MSSLGTKLVLSTVGVLVFVSSILAWELIDRERRTLLGAKEMAASMVADLLAASLAAPVDFGDGEATLAELAHMSANSDATCARVWDATHGEPFAELRGSSCESVEEPAPEHLGRAQRLSDRVIVGRRIVGRTGKEVGRLAVVFSLDRENQAFSASRTRIFWLAVALAGMTALVLIILARRLIVSPLGSLSRAARRIGSGDFEWRVTMTSKDEIGDLGNALNRMAAAIAEREQRLEATRQSLRDLFDNMKQGIVAFGRDTVVRGAASHQASVIFGDKLQGESVLELLYPGVEPTNIDRRACEEWIETAFDVPPEHWPELQKLAPRDAVLNRPGMPPVDLELEFRPIHKDDQVEAVMLLATDVTDRRKLEQLVQTQEEAHARQMAAMRRLIAGGTLVVVKFLESAEEKMARALELVGEVPHALTVGEIDELFRHAHTMKSEARAFDLRDLEAAAEALEDALDELRARARAGGTAGTGSEHWMLRDHLRRAAAEVERGRDIFVAASPIGRAALDQVPVQRGDLEELERLTSGLDPKITRVVERLAARPFGESTASLVDAVPTWAAREHKSAVFEVEGREIRIPAALADLLGGVMTHLVRNSIAHGIELPDARVSAGKPSVGLIKARAEYGERGPTIIVEDDGRGFDLANIRARATDLGATGERPEELVFVAGLSTSVDSEIAGRGVGLDAVRTDLARVGYVIRAASDSTTFARFVIQPG